MNRVYIVATPLETGGIQYIEGFEVIYSGIGKINAALSTCKACQMGYDEIVNIGSCGSLKHNAEILDIGAIYQDIDATPICSYGQVPFEFSGHINTTSASSLKCFTTDYFYDINQKEKYSPSYLYMINRCDAFDMESYAIADVCRKWYHTIKFKCLKWVSDNGGDVSWEDNCRLGFKKLEEYIIDNKY